MSGLKVLVAGFFIIFMPKLKKKAHEMSDKELLHSMFPKKVISTLKKVAAKSAKKTKKRKK